MHYDSSWSPRNWPFIIIWREWMRKKWRHHDDAGGYDDKDNVGEQKPWMGGCWYRGARLCPHLHTPFSPSLISLMVSVDIKHHVYLLSFTRPFMGIYSLNSHIKTNHKSNSKQTKMNEAEIPHAYTYTHAKRSHSHVKDPVVHIGVQLVSRWGLAVRR